MRNCLLWHQEKRSSFWFKWSFTALILFTFDNELRYNNLVRLRKFVFIEQRNWRLILFDKYSLPTKLGIIGLEPKGCKDKELPPQNGAEGVSSTLTSYSILNSHENLQLNRHVYFHIKDFQTHLSHCSTA